MFNSTYPSRCAACKYLRRKCSEYCVLAPYFPPTDPNRFLFVHKIFSASNVTRMLMEIPVQQRAQAADSISYEAYCRVHDPVYGIVAFIAYMQQQIANAMRELAQTRAQIAICMAQTRPRVYLTEQDGLDWDDFFLDLQQLQDNV